MPPASSTRPSLIPLLLALAFLVLAAGAGCPRPALAGSRPRAHFPLFFEENRGQADPSFAFVARGPGYGLYLAPEGPLVRVGSASGQSEVRMTLAGGNRQAKLQADGALPGRVNYFLGPDRSRWRTNLHTSARVLASGVYPGIDLVYYGAAGELEYDFRVAPGADPTRIGVAFDGAERVRLARSGDLELETPHGTLRQRAPVAYQVVNGRRVPVRCAFRLGFGTTKDTKDTKGEKGAPLPTLTPSSYSRPGIQVFGYSGIQGAGPNTQHPTPNTVSFALGRYDRTRPLVIDPVLVYASYLGGTGREQAFGIDVDAAGNAYLVGRVEGTDLPVRNALYSSRRGGKDGFIAKVSPTGSTLLYCTYFGGDGDDSANAIAVDGPGNAYVAGDASSGFPVTTGALQSTGSSFALKLSPNGDSLLYSTGLPLTKGSAIAMDDSGEAYVGGGEGVIKLDAAGATRRYLYSLTGLSVTAVAVDGTGAAYVGGASGATNLPVKGAFQPASNGGTDAYVFKLTPAGDAQIYASYLGGSQGDGIYGIAVDSLGSTYLAGWTLSSNFPTRNPLQATYANSGDAFVAKVSPDGSSLVYSTYIGTGAQDVAYGVRVNAAGEAYVVGFTGGYPTFPIRDPVPFGNGIPVGFLCCLKAMGDAMVFSTGLGSSSSTILYGLAIDGSGAAYVVGDTGPFLGVTPGVFQATYGGDMGDAVVMKVSRAPRAPTTLTAQAASASAINLSWQDQSSDETGFEIERKSGSGSFAPIATPGPNTTTFQDTGLSDTTAYTYRVRAVSGFGASPYSNEATATTLAPPPNVPSGLQVTALSNSSLKLTWTDTSTNETNFRVEVATAAGGPFSQIALLAANTTTFTHTGRASNTTYFYRVKAVNSGGDSSPASASGLTLPADPTNLKVTAPAGAAGLTRLDLSWTDASAQPSGFKIERKTGSDPFAQVAAVPAGTTAYSDTSLAPQTTYTYHVRATNASGDSGYTTEASATTRQSPPPVPAGLTVTVPPPPAGRTGLNLAWTATGKETGWRLERHGPSGDFQTRATLPASAASFADTNLTPATTYTYRLTALGTDVNSDPSAEASGTTLPDPPVAPSHLAVTVPAAPDGIHALKLAWQDESANEDGFRVERKDGAGAFAVVAELPAGTTAFTNTGLSAATAYTYRVRGFNTGGEGSPSGEAAATTLPEPPSAPERLTAAALSPTQIALTWSESSGATGYRVERHKPGETFAAVPNGTGTAALFLDSGVEPATTYTYRVIAFNPGGESSPSPEASATTPPARPDPPGGLQATVVSATRVDLAWTASAGADGYQVERKSDMEVWHEIARLPAGSTVYPDLAVSPATAYTYRVRASNVTGTSDYSNEASATTPVARPSAPQGLLAVAVAATRVNLGWGASTGADAYQVERKSGSEDWHQVIQLPAGTTTYGDTTVSPATTYTYRVRATNAGGESDYSNEASATTPASAGWTVAPLSLAFGPVKVGRADRLVVTVTNKSASASLRVSVGSLAAPFRLVTAVGSAFTLAPGKSRVLTVEFRPTRKVTSRATWNLSAGTTPARYTVKLTGTGK